MKILLANPRGFCAGVNMAIECLDETIRMFGSNIYASLTKTSAIKSSFGQR